MKININVKSNKGKIKYYDIESISEFLSKIKGSIRSALDSDSVNELINILELNKLDTITIIVTHDERLFTICDEIINIDYNRTNSLLKTSS